MKITVYDCVTGDALTEKHGPCSDQVIRWIAPHLPEARFEAVHIAGGAMAVDAGKTDGIIISGSEKGVYDTPAWMLPLRENLAAHRAHGTPMFGICFGHQIMADLFGGRAEKADKGFVVGARQFEMAAAEAPAFVAHQDQVTKVPPDATVLASSAYCPVAALAYDFPAASVQFHPEYDAAFTRELIDAFGRPLMSAEEVAAAHASVTDDVAPDLFAATAAELFRAARP